MYPHHADAFDTDWHSSIWRWLGTHRLSDEMHRWVVATEEGEVVGHLAAIPQFYRIGGQRVVAHTPADYEVLPGYGFHALSLMRCFFRTAENCVSCDQVQEAIAVETWLGAKEAGKLQFAAKLWNVAGVPGFLTSVPAPILQLLNFGLRAFDGALSSTFLADDLKVELIDGFDSSFDELFESVAAAVPCVPEKDATFLRWRYGPGSPQSPVLLGVRDGETLLGYAVLRVTKEGDNGYILDLTTRPGRQDVARSLLRGSIRHFARAGVYIIATGSSSRPFRPRSRTYGGWASYSATTGATRCWSSSRIRVCKKQPYIPPIGRTTSEMGSHLSGSGKGMRMAITMPRTRLPMYPQRFGKPDLIHPTRKRG